MYINLRDNELTGVIPEFIYSIPTLQELRLNNNNFEGNISSERYATSDSTCVVLEFDVNRLHCNT